MTQVSQPISPVLDDKRHALLTRIESYGSVAVALSGGVDSAVVCAAAVRALGEKAIAVTADSPSVPRADIDTARAIASQIGIRHEIILTDEFQKPDYQRNDGSRCYHCKSELYSRVEELISRLDVRIVCSGANVDDAGDYRPGLMAAAEHGVRHPLQESGFRKDDVRQLARHWGLSNWDKPASPCLSSRIAPGVEVTADRTSRIEQAEQWLKGHGLIDCRVRLHEGDLARVEVPVEAIAELARPEVRHGLVERLTELGFRFVTLDLAGLRSGSLNDLVPLEVKSRFQSKERR